MPDYNKPVPGKIIPGSALSIPQDIHVMPSGARAGNVDRDHAIKHIMQMVGMGYISVEEAEKRVAHIEQTENKRDITVLTADLPAPLDDRPFYAKYNWDNPKHWVPTLFGGMAASGVVAVVPASVLGAEHLFPGDPGALAFGMLCLIFGVLGFFGCLAGIIVKSE